jgi:AcrR family transcriptional regulator
MHSSGRGRRRSSSRAAIEEAAGELFLENSYAGTTIEHITTRAGVSRASFFNYFSAKSDLLWGDVDAFVDEIAETLAAQPATVAPMDAVRHAVVDAARNVGADKIPLAVSQWELMGAREELLASGVPRYARLVAVVSVHLQNRCPAQSGLIISSAAFALAGAVAAAAANWSAAGPSRGSLAEDVDTAVSPVCVGFEPVLR